MKRFQLFEFCDQAWLPPLLREAFHDCLGFVHTKTFRPYRNVPSLLAEIFKPRGVAAVLDIGSGGGEHVSTLQEAGARAGVALPALILSDLYPNVAAWTRLQETYGKQAVGFYDGRLDFNNVPEDVPRHWAMFASFHHLPPSLAKNLLAQAVARADSLILVEMFRRQWLDMVMMCVSAPTLLLAPFFAREFRFSKLLFTTIIPIVPVMLAVDGFVSILRSYEKDEIVAMLPPGWESSFDVQYHEVPIPNSPTKATLFALLRK